MAYSGAFRSMGLLPDPPEPQATPPSEPQSPPERAGQRRGGFDLGGILKRIEAAGMETDDLLMALILFLMYRESGDTDLLILLGVMLLT